MTDAHPRPAMTIRIGRTPDNDIVLTRGLDVSRHHAELHRNPDGSYEIIDMGSHGGTYVNGERITHTLLTEQDTQHRLRHVPARRRRTAPVRRRKPRPRACHRQRA